jgi:hypothetical protein
MSATAEALAQAIDTDDVPAVVEALRGLSEVERQPLHKELATAERPGGCRRFAARGGSGRVG